MSRIARVAAPETPHHVTQRGNNRQDVFTGDSDRSMYLECLRLYGERYGLRVAAYCLMSNHVHLIVIPEHESSMAQALGRAHYYYTQTVNRQYKRSGHLWQNRFYSCPLDPAHYQAASLYVERNPVRARMVEHAWEYRWSSARAHVEGRQPGEVVDIKDWPVEWRGPAWRRLLEPEEDAGLVERLRYATRTGRPLGGAGFVASLEKLFSRSLERPRLGRPPKRKDEDKPMRRVRTGSRKRKFGKKDH
jgi:putative transposase